MPIEDRNGNKEDADPDRCLNGCGFEVVGDDCRANTQTQIHQPDACDSLPRPFKDTCRHVCDLTCSISGAARCMLWPFRGIGRLVVKRGALRYIRLTLEFDAVAVGVTQGRDPHAVAHEGQ